MSDDLTTLPPIADALAKLAADGKKGALLLTATTDGAQVMLVARLSDVWSIDAGGEWDKDKKPIAHVSIRATW